MDIRELSNEVKECATQVHLESFLTDNLHKLRLYYYNKNHSEITEAAQDFENLFYDFKRSEGFIEFENSDNHLSEVINSSLIFFASIFERINPNPIFTILDIIPKGSVYYRLKAHLCAYEDVNDIRTHYTRNLHKILELLSLAQFQDEEDYTPLVISFLIKFYRHAVIQLSGKQLQEELAIFNSLLKDANLKESYHFLSHPLVTKMINGDIDYADELVISESATSLYYPSDKMFEIFNEKIVQLIKEDSRTRFNQILLGFPVETIRKDILEYGRADFRDGYKDLTADQKVLLYCYFNMRKHFFTSCYVFDKIYESLKPVFIHTQKTVVFIDLGCGPMTSALALADLHLTKSKESLKINYIGIDISQSMLEKAQSFSKEKIFSDDCQSEFFLSWEVIPSDVLDTFIGLDNPIIINASYLFASSYLDLDSLVKLVCDIVKKYSTSKIYFTYQNPNREDRNENYEKFKQQIVYKTHEKKVERVYYKNNPNSNFEPSAEDVYYEILELTA